jgi:small subunit ribosomal protein S6
MDIQLLTTKNWQIPGSDTLAANENVYEAMFIFDSNRFARDRGALPSEVEQMIKSAGGEVLVSRLWEERRLAYSINGHRKGTYWLIYFRAAGPILTGLNREWEVHEGILRQLVLKVHPHLVEVVLEHAKAGPAEPVAVAAAPKKAVVDEIEVAIGAIEAIEEEEEYEELAEED